MEEADYLEIFNIHPDCIRLEKKMTQNGKVTVLVTAQTFVLLAIEMKEPTSPFNVKFMHFDKYHEALVLRNNTSWETLRHAHLVIGGVEWGDDFFGQGWNCYRLKAPGMLLDHWNGLMALREETLIWPDPLDLFQQGSKLYLAHMVQAVAKSENQVSPICYVVKPTSQLVQGIIAGKTAGVLKREWGTSSTHVYHNGMPPDNVATFKLQLKFRREVEKKLKKEKNHMLMESPPQWLIQPYIRSLIRVGELRVLVVNGAILGKIVTTPSPDYALGNGYMDIALPVFVTPLPLVERVMEGGSHCSDHSNALIGNSFSLSIYAQYIEDSYENFTLRTLSKLILAEEHLTGRESGLRIFARLDLTVVRTADHQYQYLVNEITRGHNTGTWGQILEQENKSIMRELAHVLHYVAHKFNTKHDH